MNEQTSTRSRRSTGAVVLEFLGSMNLAITLLVALSIAAVVGTVLQQNQPYTDYVRKFGPFWFEVFERLGLYDVYAAGWFLVLLGFLLVSTTVCIYRNAPGMLRDMRHFRLEVQDKSLRAFHHHAEWQTASAADALMPRARAALESQGFRWREKADGDRVVLAGMKGSWNRLGYLLAHAAIVVICIGGLVDGNLPLKLAERLGRIQVETRDLPASQVPPESTLSADNSAFRGNVRIREGGAADFVFLPVRDGYLLQKLPFTVELKDFRIEHYPTGQPKSFESDVVIRDPELKEPLERTISVNHPLVYKGHAIYQATFSDGGSQISFRAYALDAPQLRPIDLQGAIYEDVKVNTPRGPYALELTDFKPYNVRPADEDSGKKFRNYGPSVTFKMRNAAGEALEFENFMAPVDLKGRLYYMSGMRTAPGAPYAYLYLPVDPKGGLDRFMRLRAAALDQAHVRRAVTEQAGGLTAAADDPKLRADLIESIMQLTALFARGGMDGVMSQVERSVPEAQRDQAMESYIMVLQSVMGSLYLDVLADEGVNLTARIGVSRSDAQYFDDALEAMAALGSYGSPLFLQVTDFQHIEASGLQITRAPGQDIVYLGCVMLMLGVFFMFYLHHRRVWVSVEPDGEGRSRVLLAGSGTRDRADFGKEFDALRAALETAAPASTNNDQR